MAAGRGVTFAERLSLNVFSEGSSGAYFAANVFYGGLTLVEGLFQLFN